MLPAALRVGIKIFSLIFCLIFVFFYVMLGLRYNVWLWKIETTNLNINFNFFSKNNWLYFEWKKYFASNGNLVIYNQSQGCYDIEFWENNKKLCWKNGVVLNQNIVSFIWAKPISNFSCQKSEWIEFEQNFWQDIVHFQRYKKIDFLFTANSIYSCNWKNDCNLLAWYSWDLVCFTKKWIVINQDSKNYLYELK